MVFGEKPPSNICPRTDNIEVGQLSELNGKQSMSEQLLTQQIALLKASRSEYETQAGNWCPKDTDEALMVHDFQDFIRAGIQHWEQTCRIRDSFLAHEAECEQDHKDVYEFIESCIKDFQSKATAVEELLCRIEKDYDVKNASKFRNALREASLLAMDFSKLEKTTPLDTAEF
jgi:hypothetical protein